ncbi:MAG TPA: winged helix-turn-helix domain-containing protein [Solirubrobacteraceae bacterium]|jgi:DNA-binding transcriptional ArsR family regulator|nr:winged helix-turn-helix domain-containing protein [Solirubrobacteraceae bacterium]
MRPISNIHDPRLVKALAHPLRVRILAVLQTKTASPSEIAEELSMPLGNVSYHVRVLADFGLIKLVRRTPRRGAIEHHYEAVGRLRISDAAWAQVPDVVKEAMIGATIMQISDYVNEAAVTGGFDKPQAHITRSPLVLDPRAFKELSAEVMKLHDRAQRLQEESIKRLEHADHEGEIEAGLVLMLFEAKDFGSAAVDGHTRSPAQRRRATASRRRRAPV